MKPIRLFQLALFLAGVLSLMNVAFMYSVANPTIGFTIQLALSLGLMLYAILLPKLPRIVHIVIGVLALIPLCFGLFLMIYGNVSNADHTEDVVIVLGAGVAGENVSRPLAHRLDAAVAYWNENPDAIIVVTGGLGNRATITEAEAMARYLIARGVSAESILLEDQSTSTYENLIFAMDILADYFPDGFQAVLITNDFHIYRAVRTARQVGLDVNRLGAYTDWYSWPVNYFREMLAVLNLWVSPARELPPPRPTEPLAQATPTPIATPAPPPTPVSTPTPEPFVPEADWEYALVEYLAQYPLMFQNAVFRDEPWGSWWQSDWEDFVEVLVEEQRDERWQLEYRGYGYTFIFRDPITGERIEIDDVPYLNRRSGAQYHDGVRHPWSHIEATTRFDLFDLTGDGIPSLVIYWNRVPWSYAPGMAVTLHQFRNGAFEFVEELSAWAGVGFFRAEDGRVFIEYGSTVAGWIDLHLFHLGNEIIIEPALTMDGWTRTVYNHLTGEYFEKDSPGSSQFVGIDPSLDRYALRSTLLGIPLTAIERMDLQTQFMKFVSAQLRAEGRIR